MVFDRVPKLIGDPEVRAKIAVAAGLGATALVALALGYLSASNKLYAIAGAGGVLILGIAATDLTFIPVLSVPCTLLLMRLSGGGSGLSVSDLILFLATFSALPLLRTKESPELRALLWCVAAYQAALLSTVVRNRYPANTIEWFHEMFLVSVAA